MKKIRMLFNRIFYLTILFFLISLDGNCTTKKTYYISSSVGKNSNPGTIYKPFQSIGGLKESMKNNSIIRLKCGDVFYESISGFENCTIKSYGKGNKPIICGFRILRDTTTWRNLGNSIWCLDLSEYNHFVGFQYKSMEIKKMYSDIGCMYDYKTDRIYGHLVSSKDSLKVDGDLFITDKYKAADISDSTYNYLYVRLSFNPGKLGNLCFSVGNNGVYNMANCKIQDIAVVGFGRHGMCRLNNSIVENCDLDIIGGCLPIESTKWVRFGNGIEFWITDKPIGNSVVRNCIISRTFDCGATIQGSSKKMGIGNPNGIHFVNNRFYYCRQAFEHFLNSESTSPQYIDCEFTGNICYMMGDNQFNSPEKRDAAILSYENIAKKLKITNNVFYGINYYCGHTIPYGMNNNKVYLFDNGYLNHFHGIKNYPTIFSQDHGAIKKYQQWSGDKSKITIIRKNTKEDIKVKTKILKKIRYSRFVLNIFEMIN